MAKPKNGTMKMPEVIALRNKAKAMGMENDDATELFVANNDREGTALSLIAWTRAKRPN